VFWQRRFDGFALLGHRFGKLDALAVVDFGDVEQAPRNGLGRLRGMSRGIRPGEIDCVIVVQQPSRFFDCQQNDAFLGIFARHEPRDRAGDGGQHDADSGNANRGALLKGVHRQYPRRFKLIAADSCKGK